MLPQREIATPVRSRLGLPAPSPDGVPEVPPELACLTVMFARGSSDPTQAPDRASATPSEWLRHYRDLLWVIDGGFTAAGRADEGPWALLERGYYRLEVVATAIYATELVAQRVAEVAREIERLLVLEGDDRPDLVVPVPVRFGEDARVDRRIELRLVKARIE